jgi:hypothetical protein
MEASNDLGLLLWLGILFCISQSAMFSGLNLAFFSVPRLRLEVEAANHNKAAMKVLQLRNNSNFLLSTILWGNVGINVLLTILSNSVMAGLTAFLFSTFLITILGEIIPQAYFSRNALLMASRLAPVLQFYQYLLFPVTKPSSMLLNWLVGQESIHFFKEKSLEKLIRKHIEEEDAEEIGYVEGIGAINFLTLDDMAIDQIGELIHPESIIKLSHVEGVPVFPDNFHEEGNPFLSTLNKSGEKWVVFIDESDRPSLVLDADGFLRAAVFETEEIAIIDYCHEPIIVSNTSKRLGEILQLWKVLPGSKKEDVIDQDLVLLWGEKKQIITGADILGRLMRGIVKTEKKYNQK